jgi:hypothetical protein
MAAVFTAQLFSYYRHNPEYFRPIGDTTLSDREQPCNAGTGEATNTER